MCNFLKGTDEPDIFYGCSYSVSDVTDYVLSVSRTVCIPTRRLT